MTGERHQCDPLARAMRLGLWAKATRTHSCRSEPASGCSVRSNGNKGREAVCRPVAARGGPTPPKRRSAQPAAELLELAVPAAPEEEFFLEAFFLEDFFLEAFLLVLEDDVCAEDELLTAGVTLELALLTAGELDVLLLVLLPQADSIKLPAARTAAAPKSLNLDRRVSEAVSSMTITQPSYRTLSDRGADRAAGAGRPVLARWDVGPLVCSLDIVEFPASWRARQSESMAPAAPRRWIWLFLTTPGTRRACREGSRPGWDQRREGRGELKLPNAASRLAAISGSCAPSLPRRSVHWFLPGWPVTQPASLSPRNPLMPNGLTEWVPMRRKVAPDPGRISLAGGTPAKGSPTRRRPVRRSDTPGD